MKVSRIKNSITYLFLVLFLTMKMAGLHSLLHTDDKDHVLHCIVCDHAIVNNLTPTLTPDLHYLKIENTEPIVHVEIIKNYNFIISSTIAPDQLFSRPPPFLL